MANTLLIDASKTGSTAPLEYALLATAYTPAGASWQDSNLLVGMPDGTYAPGRIAARLKGVSPAIIGYNTTPVVVPVPANGGVEITMPSQLQWQAQPVLKTRLSGFIDENMMLGTATTAEQLLAGTITDTGASTMTATYEAGALVLKQTGTGRSIYTLPFQPKLPFWCMEIILDGVTINQGVTYADAEPGMFERTSTLNGYAARMSYADGQGKGYMYVNGTEYAGPAVNGSFQAQGRIKHMVVGCNNFLSVNREFDDGTFGYGYSTKLDEVGAPRKPTDKVVVDSHFPGIALHSDGGMALRIVSIRVSYFQGSGISDHYLIRDETGEVYREGDKQFFITSRKGLPTANNRGAVDHSITAVVEQDIYTNEMKTVGLHTLLRDGNLQGSNCGEYLVNRRDGTLIVSNVNWGDLGVLDANSLPNLRVDDVVTTLAAIRGVHIYTDWTRFVPNGTDWPYDIATQYHVARALWVRAYSTQHANMKYSVNIFTSPNPPGPTAVWSPQLIGDPLSEREGSKTLRMEGQQYFVDGKANDGFFRFTRIDATTDTFLTCPNPFVQSQPSHANIYWVLNKQTGVKEWYLWGMYTAEFLGLMGYTNGAGGLFKFVFV